jgi:hypothetical protein
MRKEHPFIYAGNPCNATHLPTDTLTAEAAAGAEIRRKSKSRPQVF